MRQAQSGGESKELPSNSQVPLPLGEYQLDATPKPKQREEVGASAAIQKMLKSQREMLRQEGLKVSPSQSRIDSIKSEIQILLQKQIDIKQEKRRAQYE